MIYKYSNGIYIHKNRTQVDVLFVAINHTTYSARSLKEQKTVHGLHVTTQPLILSAKLDVYPCLGSKCWLGWMITVDYTSLFHGKIGCILAMFIQQLFWRIHYNYEIAIWN